MASRILLAFLAGLLLCPAGASVVGSKVSVTPIQKVLTLMEEMKAKAIAAKKRRGGEVLRFCDLVH